MLTDAQLLTDGQLLIGAFVAACPGIIVAGYLAATDRGTGGRHVADAAAPRVERIPPAPIEVRRPPLPARADQARDVDFPQARPYAPLPALVVDGPPSGHGRLPATDLPPGVVIERRIACSMCHDGQLPSMSRGGVCPWCGCRTATS